MSSGSTSDSEYKSDSSTIVNDHEPFETFKTRVFQLFQDVFGPISDKELSIERLRGGGFNKIIGVSIAKSPARQYILRVPRFEAAQLNRDLGPLYLLGRQSDVPVPKVITLDTTSCNALQDRYMIQNRIPGANLLSEFPTLTHTMRCAIARELGKVFSALQSIRSNTAGNIIMSPFEKSLTIQTFHKTEAGTALPYKDGPAIQTTSEMLCAAFESKKQQLLPNGLHDSFRAPFFDSFITITLEMSALGLLNTDYYCLCHLDLEPRNILSRPPISAQPNIITGILDWDSAIFAPPFMCASPPMWLWAWNDDADEDERLANDTPPTSELCELKHVFEDAAGPDYRRFAYGVQYRLARRLVKFAIDGLQSNEDFVRAESFIQEWTEMQPSLNITNKAALSVPI